MIAALLLACAPVEPSYELGMVDFDASLPGTWGPLACAGGPPGHPDELLPVHHTCRREFALDGDTATLEEWHPSRFTWTTPAPHSGRFRVRARGRSWVLHGDGPAADELERRLGPFQRR